MLPLTQQPHTMTKQNYNIINVRENPSGNSSAHTTTTHYDKKELQHYKR